MLAMVVLMLAGWGAGEISRAALHEPDLDAVRDLAAQRTVLLTAIAHTFSFIGSALVIGPLALVSCAALYCRGRRRPAVVIALSSGGGALIVNVDKLILGRPRPPVDHLVAASHSSFPSGHATVSASLCLALLILFLARQPARTAAIAAVTATLLLVVAIALSRVYIGVHYPTDVVGGMLLGATWSLLVGLSPRDSQRQPRAAVDTGTTSANRDRSGARGEPPHAGAAPRPGQGRAVAAPRGCGIPGGDVAGSPYDT
jgi:undecaprenyl-diphosphatase